MRGMLVLKFARPLQVLAWSYVWGFCQQDEPKQVKFRAAQNLVETQAEQLSEMIEGDPKQMNTNWLWVHLGTTKELDELMDNCAAAALGVQGSEVAALEVGEHRLKALVPKLFQDLLAFRQCLEHLDSQPASAAPEPPAAKAKAKPKPKRKPKARPRPR